MGRATRSNILKAAILLLAITVLQACSGLTIESDWDRSVNFSEFKTFSFMKENEQQINRIIDERVRAAIVENFTSIGLRQVDSSEKADLVIGFHVIIDDRTTYFRVYNTWHNHGFSSSRHHWHYSPMVVGSTTTQFHYRVGTLIIAAFQERGKELVWESTGSRTINESNNPERNEQRINDVVQRMLRNFPRD